MKVFIRTYGCQMNERDSERVAELLRRRGHVIAENDRDAEVFLVNSCSVRGKAEDKAIGKLRILIRDARRRGGRAVFGVMGCMVQRMGAELFDRVKGLDFAVGTHRLHTIPLVLDAVLAGRGPILDAAVEIGAPEDGDTHEKGRISAFLNILLGCDRRCSYCIVPDVRGRQWSRSAESVIAEARHVAANGATEITLLGQSVMSYGRGTLVWPPEFRSPMGFREPFPALLEAVSAIPGLRRIRFTSGHPSDCTHEICRAMATLPKLCPHLHLPLQSGSDEILARMNRGYTAGEYREAVRRLRAALPGIALTTDVIVGYPGETEAQFLATRALMAEIRFDNAFIFKYSPRPGTPAAAFPDDVPESEKLSRNHILLEDQDRWCLDINKKLIGQRKLVLVEGQSRRNPGRWAGRTDSNKTVIFEPASSTRPGDYLDVVIERVMPQTLYGRGGGESGENACRNSH